MKNLWFSFLVLGAGLILGTQSCKPKCEETDCVCNENCPLDTIDFTLDHTTDTVRGFKTDAELSAKVHVTNISNIDNAKIRWEITSESLPMGWTRAICDYETCWLPDTTSHTMTVAKDAYFLMKTNFYPNNTKGNGTVNVVIYAVDDSANTAQTIIFHGIAD